MAPALVLHAREDKTPPDPTRGVLDPHDINNVGFFVLFALIGVAFVVTGIWFFFWAKNGGFHYGENDWDEYKSTVLRRKGPNGTLLSGATRSTDLGGGSVYKDVQDEDDGTTVVTDSTGLSGVTAGASDIAARERRRAKQEKRERERRRRRGERRTRGHGDEGESELASSVGGGRHVGEEGVLDEAAEKEALKELRSYRHERPARVGGLNKESDGSQWDGSTNPSESSATQVSSSSAAVLVKKTTPAIRKVYSTADRNERREAERIRAEARRLREESRSRSRPARRNFSFNRPDASESAATESLLEGSDLGLGGYLPSVPESRPRDHKSRDRDRDRDREREREREREDRRARRAKGGYRRGRGEEDEL
ncbi:hypothetical protein E4U42_008101 [Claviceps africana]|uniref:Endosomal spry domain-containing protein n=1 Tax=Claviceps africana TaxID=83212 RepID=A0A8K0J310_9HYPO|nr:hypothetical protein E4U42_008101 [Claviceps africana]